MTDVGDDPDGQRPGLLGRQLRRWSRRFTPGAGWSRLASGDAARNVDTHQINCTFYDALGRRDNEYLAARAIQCFMPASRRSTTSGYSPARMTSSASAHRRGRDINRHLHRRLELAAGAAATGRHGTLRATAAPEHEPGFRGRGLDRWHRRRTPGAGLGRRGGICAARGRSGANAGRGNGRTGGVPTGVRRLEWHDIRRGATAGTSPSSRR